MLQSKPDFSDTPRSTTRKRFCCSEKQQQAKNTHTALYKLETEDVKLGHRDSFA